MLRDSSSHPKVNGFRTPIEGGVKGLRLSNQRPPLTDKLLSLAPNIIGATGLASSQPSSGWRPNWRVSLQPAGTIPE